MLILVGVSVTVSINGSLFNTTNESAYKTEISQIKEALEDEILQRKANRESTDDITIADLNIPNKLKNQYKDKLIIMDKDIYYDPVMIEKDNETAWLEEMDIIANTLLFTYNGSTITGFSEKGYELLNKGVTNFVMPSKYTSDANGKKVEVTTIGANAFDATQAGKEACAKIKKMALPNTLTGINHYAFRNCTGLTKIDIANTKVTFIGQYSFNNCTNLLEVTFPNTLKALKSINTTDGSAFKGCTNLQKVDLSNTQISYIENFTFQNCTNVAEIKLPSTLKSTGSSVFENIKGLTKIDLTNTQLTSIGNYSFMLCTNVQEVILPETVTSIGSQVFKGCKNMEKINLNVTKITTISPLTFSECTKLKSIEIPNTVTSIREGVFQSCTSLETVVLPNALVSIGRVVFADCPLINEIRIPSTVTSIGQNAFASNSLVNGKIYVPFTKAEGKPSGWANDWNNRCKATIIYSDET